MNNLARFILIAAAVIFQNAFSLTISSVLNDGGGDFDPWNQTRWAAWYSGGKVVAPFEINCSVKFADKAAPWEVDLSSLSGSLPRLFIISVNTSIDIDGNGLVIDARKEHTKSWSLYYYYTHNVSTSSDFGTWRGFLFRQNTASSAGDNGSALRNITLRGFLNAVEFDHTHKRKVTITGCTLKNNVWALFPRGANVTVRENTIIENHLGGLYCEYNSSDWLFTANTFKDNNTRGAVAYGDIVLDACRRHTISGNQFLAASYTPRDYHTAISLYRNQGEDGDIREPASMEHIIENNLFQNYNVAIDFSVREGLLGTNDKSFEARCYSNNNTVRGCSFENCLIGLNIRGAFNTVEGNSFTNVQLPVVLFCVFYKSLGNTIINQSGTDVYLWSVASDYAAYSAYVPYGNGAGAAIEADEKLFFIISDGTANIRGTQSAKVVISDSLIVPDATDFNGDFLTDISDLNYLASYWLGNCFDDFDCLRADLSKSGGVNLDDFRYFAPSWSLLNTLEYAYSNGGKPADIAAGDFAAHLAGDEIAVIWDQAVSNIEGTDYYTIIIYDALGIEIDRCGRSDKRWSKIAAGNFLPDTGYIPVNSNAEAAVVSSQPDENGMYPVYIFRKGWKEPAVVLLADNPYPICDITAGNFLTSGDEYDEIAVIFEEGCADIKFVKPSDTSWSSVNPSGKALSCITSGNFDWATTVHEVAAVTRPDPSTKLVAAWDFEQSGQGVLADKAPAGAVADNLAILGSVSITGGKALIRYQDKAALKALDSQDLDLQTDFTIWVRAKVLNEPTGFVSLVDKRSFLNPEHRAYCFLINNPSSTAGGAVPGFFGIGGQVSSDGDNGAASITNTSGSEFIPTGRTVELVMRCAAKGGLQVQWLWTAVENPASASDWQVASTQSYNTMTPYIFNSSADLYIGNNLNLDNPLATIEYDEIRIYNGYLTKDELAAIEPSMPSKADTSVYPIYQYKAGSAGAFQSASSGNLIPYQVIAGGNFDGGTLPKDEIAAVHSAGADSYSVAYYAAAGASPFKTAAYMAVNSAPVAMVKAYASVEQSLSIYERCKGFETADYGAAVNAWGDFLIIAPSTAPQEPFRPLYRVNCSTLSHTYHRTLPIMR